MVNVDMDGTGVPDDTKVPVKSFAVDASTMYPLVAPGNPHVAVILKVGLED